MFPTGNRSARTTRWIRKADIRGRKSWPEIQQRECQRDATENMKKINYLAIEFLIDGGTGVKYFPNSAIGFCINKGKCFPLKKKGVRSKRNPLYFPDGPSGVRTREYRVMKVVSPCLPRGTQPSDSHPRQCTGQPRARKIWLFTTVTSSAAIDGMHLSKVVLEKLQEDLNCTHVAAVSSSLWLCSAQRTYMNVAPTIPFR